MNKVFSLLVVLVLCGTTFFYSCRQDNKVSVAPKSCDTTDISFATVKPIFESSCVPCHAELSNEADAKTWDDFNALIPALKHDPNYQAMPQDGPKLSDCDLQRIEIWYNKVK